MSPGPGRIAGSQGHWRRAMARSVGDPYLLAGRRGLQLTGTPDGCQRCRRKRFEPQL